MGASVMITARWYKSCSKKRASCPNHLLGTACADLMAWLQPQPTRERPGYIYATGIVIHDVAYPCTDEADHTFFARSSRSAAASSICSASSFFSLAFSSSSAFRRFASETYMPPYSVCHL